MRYEVEVVVPRPLNDKTAQFLSAAMLSANKVLWFCGDGHCVRLTVEAVGMTRNEAIRQAAREIAKIFPTDKPEFMQITRI
jgi:hypothetical protein